MFELRDLKHSNLVLQEYYNILDLCLEGNNPLDVDNIRIMHTSMGLLIGIIKRGVEEHERIQREEEDDD